ncbi:Spc7-domain-containing protein [Xylariaceae sp. AK1471]|nr:Spc7-domain-containing protein [Xylariaceae sp. AK1471]
MSSHADVTIPSTRRPRKSTGHSPVRKRIEKENITVDLASSLAGNASRKKSRSKSMGPGGLDVLKSGTGNRRVSLAAPPKPQPRSILKPTMPQLPEIPPHKSKASSRKSPPSVQGLEKLPNPFQNDDSSSSGTKIALRTEEEQQAAAREREERERAQLEKDIKDRREARRKSLANRRVSFAAEATLHTFHEIEYMQDSTTSTDSTRRASSLTAQPPNSVEATDPPSTPPEQIEELVPDSPEDQRNLHQKDRRRSSGISTLDYNNNQDDLTLASSVYSSDSEATEGVTEVHEEIGSDSGSDSDADGVTMDLDVDEMTGTSVASVMSARSGFMDEENDTLDDALRLATRRAETQRIEDEEEIIPSFGWVKKSGQKPAGPTREQEKELSPTNEGPENTAAMDMEITTAVGGIIMSRDDAQEDFQEEEMSMDVTRALGGILPPRGQMRAEQSAADDGFGDDSVEDATMEFTMAVGGIRNGLQSDNSPELDDDEDMSMELTTVMGGVVSTTKPNGAKRRVSLARRRTLAKDDETTMDMTVGLGRIISADDQDYGEIDDVTMGMDMTTAVGRIIRGPSPARDQAQARQIMEQEADMPDGDDMSRSPSRGRLSDMIAARNTSEADSPGILPLRGKGLRGSNGRRASVTPKGKSPKRSGPAVKSISPNRLDLPSTPQQSSPMKTPTSLPSQRRSASPKRSPPKPTNTTPRSATRHGPKPSIFQQDLFTGATTPQVVLTPQKRQLSGVGADRSGLGSPKVAAILERRGSISDSANLFIPRENFRAVSFADPQLMNDELDRERQQEQAKENDFSILDEAVDGDEDNNTATLKDMISSMTPKKNPLKGRKSLHVGSASGLLGKRPVELDDEDDDYDRDGVKRLKNHQSSPVKNVRLRAPPSKEETTGRTVRSTGKLLELGGTNTMTPSLAPSPSKGRSLASSPRGKDSFKDVPFDQATNTFTFHDTFSMSTHESAEGGNGEHIHLQDFLNLTSIRFMELTTTKRRHTQAPTAQKDVLPGKEDLSLERCVVAGACTVPMLELYQHSCRELKKYISEGRRIVREIETETFEENPPLFKEYMSATPEFKTLMDNQFKNVKTHARLLSKAMWYEWRMKLQDGLKEGLVKISEGMMADETLLQKQQALLNSILPRLTQKFESLTTEHKTLEAIAQELEDCDPEDLQSARGELTNMDSDIETKKRKIEELRKELTEVESNIGEATQRKRSCIADFEEAEKVREECRGWTSNEINSLKVKVDELERQHGWAITGVAGNTISMTYQREIELVFDISSFSGNVSNSRIDLWYIAANRDRDPEPALSEKEFFVQCIRDHVRGMAQAQTKIHSMLSMVSGAWKKANHVAANVRLLNCTFPTNVTRTSDSSIAVRSTLLLVPLETKVEITLALHGLHAQDGFQVTIAPHVRVMYGEHFKVDKIAEYIGTRIGNSVTTEGEEGKTKFWSDVVVELHEKLLARDEKSLARGRK